MSPKMTFDFNNKNLSLTDSDQDLMVYSYITPTDDVKDIRGVVVDKEGNIVMKTFPYTPEFVLDSDNDESVKNISIDFNRNRFFLSEEGCLIRVFNYNGKWYVSTHRKLDAFQSKWSSNKSFGYMFEEALYNEYKKTKDFYQFVGGSLYGSENVLKSFLTKLDTEKSYVFLVRNSEENRIVCESPTEPKLYYTGSFNRDGSNFQFLEIHIDLPKELYLEDLTDLVQYVDNIDYKKNQGVVVIGSSGPLKILNKQYYKMFKVRGNNYNLRFRFLELINNTEDLELLYDLYPNNMNMFKSMKSDLYEIAKNIHQAYMTRFVNKEFATVPKEQFGIMKECHQWHISDRKNKVTLNKVLDCLLSKDTKILYSIWKKYVSNA